MPIPLLTPHRIAVLARLGLGLGTFADRAVAIEAAEALHAGQNARRPHDRPRQESRMRRDTRVSLLAAALALAVPGVAASAAPTDPRSLEQAWHRCVRNAYAHQPAGQSRAGNERNALDECKAHEDAYVSALMADRPRTVWARAWSSIIAPLAGWIDLLRR